VLSADIHTTTSCFGFTFLQYFTIIGYFCYIVYLYSRKSIASHLTQTKEQLNKTGPLNITSISLKRLCTTGISFMLQHCPALFSSQSSPRIHKKTRGPCSDTFTIDTVFKKMQKSNKWKAFYYRIIPIIHKK